MTAKSVQQKKNYPTFVFFRSLILTTVLQIMKILATKQKSQEICQMIKI